MKDITLKLTKEAAQELKTILAGVSFSENINEAFSDLEEALKLNDKAIKIKLVKTCDACPEQYEAFLDDKQVGYLRLRHGSFTVSSPCVNGEDVYQAFPCGDGMFDDEERAGFLFEAKLAIIKHLEKER